MNFLGAAIAMSIFAILTLSFAGTQTVLPSDDEIRKILAERLGENEKDVGIVVGVIDPESPADWGLPKLRIRPESQRDFFATELPLRVTFQTGSDGKVRSLTIYPPRGQKGVPANKLAADK